MNDPHAAEARARWPRGYAESRRRTARYTDADWQAAGAEMEELARRFAALLRAGWPAESAEATATAEAHRRHVSERYYDCPPQMHAGLAELYVADHRFTDYWEGYAPGLARYVHDAIRANAAEGSAPT